MYFCMMKENYVKPVTEQKYVEIEGMCNQESLENFRKNDSGCICKGIYRLIQMLTTILSHLLEIAKTLHIPKKKTRKFHKRKHRKDVWMTNDLLTKVAKKNELYVKWIKLP